LTLSFLDSLILVIPLLGSIAYLTLAERKVMGSMQRRLGPNQVGSYGLLQPLSDGLKLLVKESVLPSQANKGLFYLAPFITLTLSLLGWIPIPFAKASPLADMSLGLLYLMALSSLGVYGVLLAGWSANSKYAFIGSLRSTAQLVSYELPFALLILIVVIIPGSLSLSHIIEAQEPVWYLVPLLPIWVLWVMVVVAETNRAPFDLPESESELVAGFFTEHSALPFAYFFLAEYGSMILISVLSSILFLGGYLLPGDISTSPVLESLVLGVKSCFLLFLLIWIRASFPRVRFDQLMYLCWAGLIPILFGLVILVPSILVAFDILP